MARPAARDFPVLTGAPPPSRPACSDRRRTCAGVHAPSLWALPGSGLPDAGGCRFAGRAHRCRRQAQNEVRSTWALTPSGLADGDQFRLIFITSTGATPRRPTSGSTTPSCRTRRRRGTCGHPALQLAVPGGGVHPRGRCPRQHGHHRDRGAHLLAERQQGRRQLRGLLRRKLGRRGEPEVAIGNRLHRFNLSYFTGSKDDGTEYFASGGSSGALGADTVQTGTAQPRHPQSALGGPQLWKQQRTLLRPVPGVHGQGGAGNHRCERDLAPGRRHRHLQGGRAGRGHLHLRRGGGGAECREQRRQCEHPDFDGRHQFCCYVTWQARTFSAWTIPASWCSA